MLPYVRSLATRFVAKVTLFSVVPPTWESPPKEMRPLVNENPAESMGELQAHLDAAVIDDLSGVQVDRVADAGEPARRIVAFAEAHSVDLVMMPTHGLGLFRSMLIGSVTAKVLHDTRSRSAPR